MLPDDMRRLFWDIDTGTFDPQAFPQYTIERVLEYGDAPAVAWLRSLFSTDAIASALRDSRQLSPRSANFWALILDQPRTHVRALQEAWWLVRVAAVRPSFLHYGYPLLFETRQFKELMVADVRDIACMKLDALASRGTRRDFIDLYFVLQQFPLADLLSWFEHKYRAAAPNQVHLAKALTYFVDAEQEPMPRLLQPVDWQQVRSFFESEARRQIRF